MCYVEDVKTRVLVVFGITFLEDRSWARVVVCGEEGMAGCSMAGVVVCCGKVDSRLRCGR